MSRTKAPAIPDTKLLRLLMEEYLEMMREVKDITEKALALDPETEEFWDHVCDHAAEIDMLGIRSNTIVEEVDELIDKLPDDD